VHRGECVCVCVMCVLCARARMHAHARSRRTRHSTLLPEQHPWPSLGLQRQRLLLHHYPPGTALDCACCGPVRRCLGAPSSCAAVLREGPEVEALWPAGWLVGLPGAQNGSATAASSSGGAPNGNGSQELQEPAAAPPAAADNSAGPPSTDSGSMAAAEPSQAATPAATAQDASPGASTLATASIGPAQPQSGHARMVLPPQAVTVVAAGALILTRAVVF
jgi:hypothetical protein